MHATKTISRRHSLLVAFGAALLAAVSRRRRTEVKPTFAENTEPGDRYRTLSVGGRALYLREDLVRSGWYRDFRFHRRGNAEP